MSAVADQHAAEIRDGIRFEFGKNWKRFLNSLTDERIALAQRSLIDCLELPRLDGLRFLDIGSGSGLFSLAARRLGASVTSFDYDPHSVGCTAELRRRYFPDDPRWQVLQGSALDPEFLAGLGPADIVYSWGVLHHTGAMHAAFENVKALVPVGGRLFIAIYNDLGEVTDRWWRIKQRYNSLPRPLKLPFALAIIAASEGRILAGHLRRRDFFGYLRTWSEYQYQSVRGMSRWHDWIDWIGGFPYERASIDAVVDVFARSGFRLTKVVDRSSGYGCNEFVFRRDAEEGTWIDNPVPGSRLLSRRFGMAARGLEKTADGGLRARLPGDAPEAPETEWLLLREDRFLGRLAPSGPDGTVRIPPEMVAAAAAEPNSLRLVPGRCETLNGPYVQQQGAMWMAQAPRLSGLADNAPGFGADHRSPVFVFEDGVQLPYPHSLHDDIRQIGRGRFSHWGEAVYFSTTDGTDPNRNGREYSIIRPNRPTP